MALFGHEGHPIGTEYKSVIRFTCCIMINTDLDGATPIKLGPMPFHKARPPSVSMIWRMNLMMKNPPRGFVGEIVVVDALEDIEVVGHSLVEADSVKVKFTTEDCKRVLTTSSGHVAMAPIVPPALRHELNKSAADVVVRMYLRPSKQMNKCIVRRRYRHRLQICSKIVPLNFDSFANTRKNSWKERN